MFRCAILFLFAIHVFAEAPCCKEKERSASYLDIAIDLISKAKSSIPECKENKQCPEIQVTDCADWYGRGHNKSGVYSIRPISRLTSNKSLSVFCDMDTDGGGWTVIQRRGNFGRPNDYFYKDWASYKEGFGDVDRDFWLGNDNIFALTNQKPCSIRFDLQDKDLKKAYANYSDFYIDDESNKFMLHITGYSGDAGDSMAFHNNLKFSTKDQDNDNKKKSCATVVKSAWWYNDCSHADLNKVYNLTVKGIYWDTFRTPSEHPLVWTEMKIRPRSFAPQFFI